jgi:hypothetical protein
MKPLRSKPVVSLGLVLLALCLGCAQKKVAKAPPPPVAVPESTPQPQEAQAQTQAQPPTQGTPPPSPDQGEPRPDSEKANAKNGKAHPAKKAAPTPEKGKTAEAARNIPPRTVVRPEGPEPSPTPGQISPNPSEGGPHDQATTEQLLQTTESGLTGIKRQLSQDEEAMVSQIKDFVGQSRQAIKENDLVRAHNLALKAHLLCDDLIKRR